jgi:uncharacterized membrane protein
VLVLALGAVLALSAFGAALFQGRPRRDAYNMLRAGLERTILLSLEFLVAADIIRSVALEPTLLSIGVLGLLVIIRTFLSWSLEVEIESTWPWSRRPPDQSA